MSIKEEKKKIRKRLKIFSIIITIILIIYIVYNVGRMRGIIEGVGVTVKKYNSSVCDFLNKTRDENGYCILEEGQKYEMVKECWYENFIVKGEKELPMHLEPVFFPQKILYYPFIGCW